MSIRLMSEVWRTNLPTVEKMVLLVIADHASDDGTEAWPSQATIAAKASISIRTVQRAVNSLVEKGYLWMAKGAGGSATCRDDRRPHKYTLRLEKLRGDTVTTRKERGDNHDNNEATLTTSTGRQSRPMNHPNEPSNETPNGVVLGDFDTFWNLYPRKAGKKAARVAFKKALAEATYVEILNGTIRYANDPNRKDEFTAHPSTWLNQGRWADDPLPDRTLTPDEKKAAELELARRKAQAEQEAHARWKIEQEEAAARSVPMPENLRELFRGVRRSS